MPLSGYCCSCLYVLEIQRQFYSLHEGISLITVINVPFHFTRLLTLIPPSDFKTKIKIKLLNIMVVEELTGQNPDWSCVCLLISPSSFSIQAVTVALADPVLIPVALPTMIDVDKTHTYLSCCKCGPHTYHQDHPAVPRLVLWQLVDGMRPF